MRRALKWAANEILKPFGFELCWRNEYKWLASEHRTLNEKYNEIISEIHGCFSELIFPKLPQCNQRTELLAKLIGTPVSESMYILGCLHESLHLDGDVCEFGIAQGATSALLANEIQMTQKHLWLFDSFKGLPRPTDKDVLINDIFNLGSMEKYEGTMACYIHEVQNKLQDIGFPPSRTKIVSGFIEETIKYKELPKKVCFAYIDFDFYNPIMVALRFLNDSLSNGGSVVIDDYGFFSAGAKTAVDEFVEKNNSRYEVIFPYKFASKSTPFCILRKKF